MFFERRAQSSSQISVAIRPARRSVTMPLASNVQKFARAATSPTFLLSWAFGEAVGALLGPGRSLERVE